MKTLQSTDANIKQVAVGGLGGWGAGIEVQAVQAAACSLVVTGRAHSLLAWALHAQEPGAPVQKEHAGLWDETI